MSEVRKLHQERLLDQAMEKSRPVTAFLKNGVQVKGKVLAHDNFTILLDTERNLTLVYKHSITSLFPVRFAAPRR
ncbi:MAG: RNA chaperone Hfq [Leptospirales bacterium]|nr:RNA chaperone Hfq [Leptospirales bacterium]